METHSVSHNECVSLLVAPTNSDVLSRVAVGYHNSTSFPWEDESEISTVFIHPSHNNHTFSHAVAILQLVNASSDLDVIRLNSDPNIPSLSSSSSGAAPLLPLQKLTILGAGLQEPLLEATVNYMSKESCQAHRNAAGFPYVVDDSQLCAGGSTTGFCDEDWGGPLIIKAEDSRDASTANFDLQVGIISW